jgi:hypothetical protein
MRLRSLLSPITLAATLPWTLAAQVVAPPPGTPYQFAIEDYARAERLLAPSTLPLVTGTATRATWLSDGRAVVSRVDGHGEHVPGRESREEVAHAAV